MALDNGNYIRISGIKFSNSSMNSITVYQETHETEKDRNADDLFRPAIEDKHSVTLSDDELNSILDIIYPIHKAANYPDAKDV